MALFHTLAAAGIRVTLDLRAGHVRELTVTAEGRDLTPFHTAPWLDDPVVQADETLPLHLRLLSGDFFCAPFAASDVEEAPSHGWTANSPWTVVETTTLSDGITALYRLDRPVLGATVEKRFTLHDHHPFVYQTHTFMGGEGAVPVANHAMVRVGGGGRLAFSAKAAVETPDVPVETDPARGRSALTPAVRGDDPTRVPKVDGGSADLTRLPFDVRHEDVAMLVERRGSPLGWLAVSRSGAGDAMISLKDPADFPVTVLWFSNGGRFYAPWNGRHAGVLGVEEARSDFLRGHRSSILPNALTRAGIATALALRPDGSAEVRNVIGAVPLPAGGSPIADLVAQDSDLAIACENGTRFTVPFDTAFLAPASGS